MYLIMRPILNAAEKIHELQNNLEIISTDDRKEIADYTDAERKRQRPNRFIDFDGYYISDEDF